MMIKKAKVDTINDIIKDNKVKQLSLMNIGNETKVLLDIMAICNIEDLNKLIKDLQTVKSVVDSNTDLIL